MLDFVRKLFARRAAAGDSSEEDPFEPRQVAATALLIEAAWLDSDFAAEERTAIVRLVGERFGLAAEKAGALVAHAERQQGAAYSGWQSIKIVREGFEPEERAQVVEMLWAVACADGTLRPFEKQMVERVGEELDLPAGVVEAARQRAMGGTSAEGN